MNRLKYPAALVGLGGWVEDAERCCGSCVRIVQRSLRWETDDLEAAENGFEAGPNGFTRSQCGGASVGAGLVIWNWALRVIRQGQDCIFQMVLCCTCWSQGAGYG